MKEGRQNKSRTLVQTGPIQQVRVRTLRSMPISGRKNTNSFLLGQFPASKQKDRGEYDGRERSHGILQRNFLDDGDKTGKGP